MSTDVVKREISDKTVKTHSIFILIVCAVFGAITIARGNVLIGGCTFGLGVVVTLVSFIFMKNSDKVLRGTFLTQASVVLIVFLSAVQGELHGMFAVLAANIAIASVYYDLRNIKLTWVLTDIALIGGCFIKDLCYIGIDISIIIKGIVGVNIAGVMIMFLVKSNIKSIANAVEMTNKADELLEQVKSKMQESEQLTQRQAETVSQVADAAGHLEFSSNSMLDISNRLTAASEEQNVIIADIFSSIETLVKDSQDCFVEAEKSSEAAERSTEMLNSNVENMQLMVNAMNEINETSSRISGIIKTIDDISFQTNILALNAAVEAARAGAAGKGFAVVADEVRNLANKSAEAAKNTASLINESIKAVENGTQYAQNAAGQMDSILEFSRLSEEHAKKIAELTRHQQDEVSGVRSKIESISGVIAENNRTAGESAEIARQVSQEVENMNIIVSQK